MNNSDTKKQHRQDFLEEGRKMRVNQADEVLKLETIKSKKIQLLQDLGIQGKYMGGLERKKIAF